MDSIYSKIPKCKIYISGKITGLDLAEAERLFSEAEEKLRAVGHTVVNPMKVLPYHPDHEWRDYMRADIKALVDCDAIYMLSNWTDSKGAKVEFFIAEKLDLTILYQL